MSLLFNSSKGAIHLPIICFHPSGKSFLSLIHQLLPLKPICMMRTAFPLLLVAFIQRVASSRYPLLQWDPETVEDCIEWYDNGQGKTCEWVRELYGCKSPCTADDLLILILCLTTQTLQQSLANGTLQSALIANPGIGNPTVLSRKGSMTASIQRQHPPR